MIIYFLGLRLIFDTDPDCKRESGKCIEEMLMRLPNNEKNKLYEWSVILKLKDEKVQSINFFAVC